MDWSAAGGAGGLCLAMIVAEAALTGSELQRWLASLKHPRLYAPFWVWIAAAIATYVIQGVITYRLLRMSLSPATVAALGLLVTLMAANIGYNIVLDRSRNPRLAFRGILWFLPLLAGLQISLHLTDQISAAVNLIYVVWVVGYDLPIMHALSKLNT